jgi:hypothetical protein
MSMSDDLPPGLKAALDLASLGLRVFPVVLVGTKKMPAIKGWQKLATSDPEGVRQLFRPCPTALVGIVTGRQDWKNGGGIVGIDVDPKNGGNNTFAELEARLGKLPDDVVSQTPSGGRHYYLQRPVGVWIKTTGGEKGLGKGIDVRGSRANGDHGGFLVGPGSVRPGGKSYAWLGDSHFVLQYLGPSEIPWPWLYCLVFSARGRRQLAEIGIHGPDAFGGADPVNWQPVVDERLRAAWLDREQRRRGARLTSTGTLTDFRLSAEGTDRVSSYVIKAIQSECQRIWELRPGQQQTESHALNIHALLKGAALIGIDPTVLVELTNKAREGYLKAVCAMELGNPNDPWTDEHAIERWDRNEEEAAPRDLFMVAPSVNVEPIVLPPNGYGPNGEVQSHNTKLLRWLPDEPPSRRFEWLVKNLIPAGSLGMIAAQPKTGKTFVATHLSLCIASGKPFFGRKIKRRCGVYYIAAEGSSGLAQRFRTAQEHSPHKYDDKECPILLDDRAPSLAKDPDVVAFVEHVKYGIQEAQERFGVPLGLIVFDTFSRSFNVEDENSAGEISRLLKVLTRITQDTNAAVLIIHHHTKNGTAPRGSGVLTGDPDYVMSVKDGGKLELTLAREASTGVIGTFALRMVKIGDDEDGEAMTSCYIEEGGQGGSKQIDISAIPEVSKPLSSGVAHLIESLRVVAKDGLARMRDVRKAFHVR